MKSTQDLSSSENCTHTCNFSKIKSKKKHGGGVEHAANTAYYLNLISGITIVIFR